MEWFFETVRRDEKAKHARQCPNILEAACIEFGIVHKFILPRIPEHNGKVERSHRIDQDKFYRTSKFYSLDVLRKQRKAWNNRYNETPRFTLKCKNPNEIEVKLKEQFLEIRSKQGPKSLTSIES